MAAGSLARSVCLYDASGGEPRLLRSLKTKEHRGSGITQVKFHPTSPELLYTASRCSDAVVVWDIRNPKHELYVHNRQGQTNQKIAFDIDVWGKWLVTGDTVRFSAEPGDRADSARSRRKATFQSSIRMIRARLKRSIHSSWQIVRKTRCAYDV